MWGIVGLGNPGTRYAGTRHNAGFWVVDELAQRIVKNAGWSSKSGCDSISLRVGSEKCLAVKPQKYMNLSGEAAAPLLRYYRIEPENIIIIHDELDLEPGRVQVKVGGGTGGHRGVENLVQHLGTRDFVRIRVGIGRPRKSGNVAQNEEVSSFDAHAVDRIRPDVTSWVLGRPGPEEKELLDDAVSQSVKAVELCVSRGAAAAQRHFNKKSRKSSADCRSTDKGAERNTEKSALSSDRLKTADGDT